MPKPLEDSISRPLAHASWGYQAARGLWDLSRPCSRCWGGGQGSVPGPSQNILPKELALAP